jgi:O-antigen/teichoic acid export membrane protein
VLENEDHHRLARGAVANVFVLIAGNFRGVFTFLIARILGEAALGRFGLMWATTELLSQPGMLGLDSGVIPLLAGRITAGDGEGARAVFKRGIIAAVVVSTAIAAAGVPLLAWLGHVRGIDAFTGGGAVMLLALPGIALSRISTGASRTMLSMRNEFYSRGIAEVWVTTAVFVLALAIGLRLSAPSIAVVVGSTAGGIVALILAIRVLRAPVGSVASGRPSLETMLRFTAPIAGSSLLDVLVMQVDVLLLGLYIGRAPGVTVETFGVFCAAAEVAGGMRKVRQVFDPILAPVAAARAAAEDHASLAHTVAGPGRWVLSAQLPLVGGLLLSSGFVLGIYGPAFRQGALWLALLGLAHGANSFAGIVETLFMIERPSLNLVNSGITVVVQVVTGVLLIPYLGVTGAAMAMLVGFTVQGILRFVEVRHVFGWSWPWATLKRPMMAFTIAIIPSALLRLRPGLTFEVVSGLAFFALYAAAWYMLGADPTDRDVWRRLTRPPAPARAAAIDSIQ